MSTTMTCCPDCTHSARARATWSLQVASIRPLSLISNCSARAVRVISIRERRSRLGGKCHLLRLAQQRFGNAKTTLLGLLQVHELLRRGGRGERDSSRFLAAP